MKDESEGILEVNVRVAYIGVDVVIACDALVEGVTVVFFFFSSRRRHTRLQGDWSSDVCSSDLGGGGVRRPFGIDLSSGRVRVALSILDGVRAGQQLGALLGYRFERSLQAREIGRASCRERV